MDLGHIVQLHVTKTGGSALRAALRGTGARRWGHSYVLGPRLEGDHYVVPYQRPGRPDGVAAHRDDFTYHVGQPTPEQRFLVTVRDPVKRFISAYAWSRDRLAHRGYPDADSLARDLNDEALANVVFHPQVDWLICPERLREPDILWIGHTETLAADFERLRVMLGLDDSHQLPAVGDMKRNAGTYADELSPLGEANIRDWYAEDIRLLEAL